MINFLCFFTTIFNRVKVRTCKYNQDFGQISKANTYLINKTSTAKLSGETMAKNLSKTLLMMIITIMTWIIDAANIKNCIKTF